MDGENKFENELLSCRGPGRLWSNSSVGTVDSVFKLKALGRKERSINFSYSGPAVSTSDN